MNHTYIKNDLDTVVQERDNRTTLLRELVMRGNFCLPEDQRDLEWFELGTYWNKSVDFFERINKDLKLGVEPPI